MIQSLTPSHLQGRVMALWLLAFAGVRPVVAPVVGMLSDAVGVASAVGVLALTIAVVAAAGWRPITTSRSGAAGGAG